MRHQPLFCLAVTCCNRRTNLFFLLCQQVSKQVSKNRSNRSKYCRECLSEKCLPVKSHFWFTCCTFVECFVPYTIGACGVKRFKRRKSGGFLHRKGRKRGKEKRKKREIQNSWNAKFHLLLTHVAVGFKES